MRPQKLHIFQRIRRYIVATNPFVSLGGTIAPQATSTHAVPERANRILFRDASLRVFVPQLDGSNSFQSNQGSSDLCARLLDVGHDQAVIPVDMGSAGRR
jgi:hypothetical protein